MPACTLDEHWRAIADAAAKKAGLSTEHGGIKALAEMIGVHRDTIWAYCHGKHEMSKPVALHIHAFCLEHDLTIPFEVHKALSRGMK